ncbi:MAG: hypothetical protein MR902_08700 [Campylobacter sp.]|nr:hypothetical protein [Campylobacter sp.]
MNLVLKQNLFYAFLGQIISLLLSFVLAIVLPKYLTLNDFAYWQLFIFYLSYIGIFHCGISDGILLRFGGKNINNIKPQFISSQLHILLLIQIFFSCIILIAAIYCIKSYDRKFILFTIAFYLIFNTIFWFFGMLLQAVNLTKNLSQGIMIEKAFVVIFFLLLIVVDQRNFMNFIYCFTISKVISTFFLLIKFKRFILNKTYTLKFLKKETIKNIKVGLKLTIANISALLILGIGRFCIDIKFGLLSFNQVSFALSLVFFLVTFLNQICLVFFPFIKSMPSEKYSFYAKRILFFLMIIIPICYIMFMPFKFLITVYLPMYAEAVQYMIILFPICIFEIKTQMFCMTFYKVLRMEKKLLYVNLLFVLVSAVLYIFGAFYLENIVSIIISMVIIIICKNIVMEIILSNKLNITVEYNIALLFLTVIFYILNIKIDNDFYSFAFMLIASIFIIFIEYNKIILRRIK